MKTDNSEDFSRLIYEVANKNNLITENIEPIVDGIIEPDKYWNCDKKLLFVLKEPYDSLDENNIPCGGGYGLGGAIQKDYMAAYKIRTNHNIINFSYAFLNGLDHVERKISEKNVQETVDSIAIINLSKMPNHTSTKDYKLWKYYEIWREVLLEQIKYINPDYIFFGHTLRYFAKDLLNEEDQKNIYSPNIHIFKYGNQIYINEIHPERWIYSGMDQMLIDVRKA